MRYGRRAKYAGIKNEFVLKTQLQQLEKRRGLKLKCSDLNIWYAIHCSSVNNGTGVCTFSQVSNLLNYTSHCMSQSDLCKKLSTFEEAGYIICRKAKKPFAYHLTVTASNILSDLDLMIRKTRLDKSRVK